MSFVALSYEERGSGDPIVFLHGAGLSRRLWEPQLRLLSDRFRCVALDLRGHGPAQAVAPPDVYRIEDHAGDVLAALDALGIERAHVVGLSLGGMVCLEFGLRHPERVVSIVTIGTPVDARPNVFAAAALALGTRYLFLRLRRSGVEWLAASSARRWSKQADVRAYMIEDCRRLDADEFVRVWRGVVRYSVRDGLADMKPPVLAIAGSKDPNRRQARLSARLMPNARFELVEGAGHITNRDAPAAVDALLESWLAEHRTESSR